MYTPSIKPFILGLFLTFFYTTLVAQEYEKIQLAEQYLEKGEAEKATNLFEQLAKNKENFSSIANNYSKLLTASGKANEAIRFLKKATKQFPNNYTFQVLLCGILLSNGDEEAYESTVATMKKKNASNAFQLSLIAMQFVQENLYDAGISFYKDARKLKNDSRTFSLELASIYRNINKKEKMIEEYLNYIDQDESKLFYVRNIFQNIIQDEDLELLESVLIKKNQEFPEETKYAKLLMWVELQRKNFYGAYIQARAIDKRTGSAGSETIKIGYIAESNEDYEAAIKIYEYVIDNYFGSLNYGNARAARLGCKEKKIKSNAIIDTLEVQSLVDEYKDLYFELRPNPIASNAIRKVALLYAFYLNEADSAIALLQRLIIQSKVSKSLISQSKLDLGDIYLLKGEPWESTLLYSQVGKTHKSSAIGYEALLKNAQLNYFTGNFALAKSHLDILKRNTTRFISNDAINLGALISDNTALDTSDITLQQYADAELLLFQNKNEQAKEALTNMLSSLPSHPIQDEVHWLLTKIELKYQNIEGALKHLNYILEHSSSDILADDAAFKKAEIYDFKLKEVNKAMELYQQFLVDFAGSLYVAEARKRFRKLRGDNIN